MGEYVLQPLQIIPDDDFFLYRLQCLEWVLTHTHHTQLHLNEPESFRLLASLWVRPGRGFCGMSRVTAL